MKIKLVTDSTSDIPPDLAAQHQIEIEPILLVIDGRSFIDGEGISREEFYTRMPTMQSPPTTAAPSVGSFMARYERILSAGAEKIISIHAASNLSGIFNAARLAAESFGGRVHVFDSGQLSLGCGFQVLSAAEAIAQGVAFDEIETLFENVQKRIKLVALLDTLEYLRRSGRVSWAKATLGSFFRLKPMIELTYGRVENLGAVRTKGQGKKRLLEILRNLNKLERLAILHTNAEDRAHELLAEFAPKLPSPPLMFNVTPAIGAHLGPNGIGFVAVRK